MTWSAPTMAASAASGLGGVGTSQYGSGGGNRSKPRADCRYGGPSHPEPAFTTSQPLHGHFTTPMTVAAVIDAARSALTPAERRVADVVLTSPEAIAFGTVADLAQRAATSGATVVRLAAKLGYDGFTSLPAAVQGGAGQ